MKPKMITITVQIPQDVENLYKLEATRLMLSKSDVIRRALTEWLKMNVRVKEKEA